MKSKIISVVIGLVVLLVGMIGFEVLLGPSDSSNSAPAAPSDSEESSAFKL